jgi:hypothetical protein
LPIPCDVFGFLIKKLNFGGNFGEKSAGKDAGQTLVANDTIVASQNARAAAISIRCNTLFHLS